MQPPLDSRYSVKMYCGSSIFKSPSIVRFRQVWNNSWLDQDGNQFSFGKYLSFNDSRVGNTKPEINSLLSVFIYFSHTAMHAVYQTTSKAVLRMNAISM